jgi:hypothetical protein
MGDNEWGIVKMSQAKGDNAYDWMITLSYLISNF